MPLIYITGPSGAGKSTVCKELQKRGYEAHDTDEDGMSAWYSIETNERVQRPGEADRSEDWYKHHAYRMLPERVKALAERAKDKPVFLCGIPSNDLELAEYYDKVICLVIDEEVMKQRVASRETNNFGKAADELELMLYWHGKMLERYEKFGAIMIDATKPLHEVVGEIIKVTENNSYTALIKGKQVIFRHVGAAKLPPFKFVTSVSVIPFTKDGDIVAVRLRHRGLDLPGGHIEPHETTPEQTMNREVMEEACITIKNPVIAEVIESDYFDHPSYMLLYGAFVDELHPFATPEDEMSDGREIVSQDEFIQQYEAGNKELMSHAIQTAWQKLKGLQ